MMFQTLAGAVLAIALSGASPALSQQLAGEPLASQSDQPGPKVLKAREHLELLRGNYQEESEVVRDARIELGAAEQAEAASHPPDIAGAEEQLKVAEAEAAAARAKV